MSRLFEVPHLGAGTPDVESLFSYVLRLAAAHTVSIHQLLRSLPKWQRNSSEDYRATSQTWRTCQPMSLFRPNSTCKKIQKLLTRATGLTSLRSATLFALEPQFGRATSFCESSIKWCRHCFHDAEITNEPNYFKLSWCFKHINYCDSHHTALTYECANCGIAPRWPKVKRSIICCANCESPLSTGYHKVKIVPPALRSCGDLFDLVSFIAMFPSAKLPTSGTAQSLDKILAYAEGDGSYQHIVQALSLFDLKYCDLRGPKRLTLTSARALALISGIPLVDILCGKVVETTRPLSASWILDVPDQYKPSKRKKHDHEAIKRDLQTLLIRLKDTNPPLTIVAKELGVSKGYLLYRFPHLARKVCQRYMEEKDRIRAHTRIRARSAAIQFFTDRKISKAERSRKNALRVLRKSTGIAKNVLREEIADVYKMMMMKQLPTRPRRPTIQRRSQKTSEQPFN